MAKDKKTIMKNLNLYDVNSRAWVMRCLICLNVKNTK